MTVHPARFPEITVKNWFGDAGHVVEQIRFADGTTWYSDQILGASSSTPTVPTPIANPRAAQDVARSFALPTDAFTDADTGGSTANDVPTAHPIHAMLDVAPVGANALLAQPATASRSIEAPLQRGAQERLLAAQQWQSLMDSDLDLTALGLRTRGRLTLEPYKGGPIPPQTEAQRINAMADYLVQVMAGFPPPAAHTSFTPLQSSTIVPVISGSLN